MKDSVRLPVCPVLGALPLVALRCPALLESFETILTHGARTGPIEKSEFSHFITAAHRPVSFWYNAARTVGP